MDKNSFTRILIFSLLISIVAGFVAGGLASDLYYNLSVFSNPGQKITGGGTAQLVDLEEQRIKVVRDASPAVVSIIITKDLPIVEKYFGEGNSFQDFLNNFFGFNLNSPQNQQNGTQKQEVGGGTGFIVSSDGLILTNKHVVEDEQAEYTVLTNEGKKFPARVLARDPVQDIAIIKIEQKNLPILTLGDSDKIAIGQSVIAIGNALGEFRNTVSAGVVSGLKRSLTALGGSSAEQLENVIQTDAAINPGNSGGPLLNLKGEVIAINVAIVQDAQNIGFALPINQAQRDLEQIRKSGKISYPYLGVRYCMITPEIKEKNNLSVDYGALVLRGENEGDLAIVPGSPADKAGILENDIILEVDGQKVENDNCLALLIQSKNVGDIVTLKILSKGKEKTVRAVLEERK